jgi:hypothetical protein
MTASAPMDTHLNLCYGIELERSDQSEASLVLGVVL